MEGEKINGVRKGKVYINGWGKKRGVYIEREKTQRCVCSVAGASAAAAEPGNEKLTDVYSSRTHR
jgi:hypothetical protein